MSYAHIANVRKDRDSDITDLGAKDQWKWPVADVVASIEEGSDTFYVICPQRAEGIVAKTPVGRKFPKTAADTTTKNNLDELPPLERRGPRAGRR